MSINLEAGRYTIFVNNDVAGTIDRRALNMQYEIPQQRLRLRGYRVETGATDGADSLASKCLWIDITNSSGSSLLSSNHLIDSNPNTLFFSLALDNAKVTNRDSLNKVLYMSKKGDSDLKLSVYKMTGVNNTVELETKLISIYLDFETEQGSL